MKRILLIKYISIILFFICAQAEASEPKVVYSSSNDFGHTFVYEVGEIRCLSFDTPSNNIIQSCIYKNITDKMVFDYTKMLLGSLYINNNPRKILMIGLGGAVVANALTKLLPTAHLDVVEINPDVMFVAKKYFFFKARKNTNEFIKDGYDFIKDSPPNTYDLIILDAFTKDYTPQSFLTLAFIENIKKALRPGGIVAVNTLTKDYNINYELESRLYRTVFSNLFELTSNPNRVILGRNEPFPSLNQIQKESSKWNKKFQLIGIDRDWLVDLFTFPKFRQ